MGSSGKASNKSHPATPCDGSAVELVALRRAILGWLIPQGKNVRIIPLCINTVVRSEATAVSIHRGFHLYVKTE
jgi:hypothetical protein